MCTSRFLCRGDDDGDGGQNETATLRATIISNLLSEDNDRFVLRRAVLEKFFSDVSKCLTAKDFISGSSFIRVAEYISTPKSATAGNNDDDNDGDDGEDDEASVKSKMGDGTKPGGEADIEEGGKPKNEEDPDTPATLHITEHSSDCSSGSDCECDSNLSYDDHDQDTPPVLKRLFQDPDNINNNERDTLATTPSDDAECDRSVVTPSECQEGSIISEGGEETEICHGIDALERGDQEVYEDNVIESVCPICLDPYDEGDFIIESKHCSHLFHKSCILLWLEQNDHCPCCREPMITDEEVQATALSVVGTQRMFSVINEYSMQHSI